MYKTDQLISIAGHVRTVRSVLSFPYLIQRSRDETILDIKGVHVIGCSRRFRFMFTLLSKFRVTSKLLEPDDVDVL